MAKKGTTNAFLQYKEDRTLGVRHTHTHTRARTHTHTQPQSADPHLSACFLLPEPDMKKPAGRRFPKVPKFSLN